MNKLILKNSIKNFKRKFRVGGLIPKFEIGQPIWQRPVSLNSDNSDNFIMRRWLLTLDEAQLIKAAEERTRKKKGYFVGKNTAKLQATLFRLGAYKGEKNRKGLPLSFNDAVDGNFGPMSKRAVERAKAMGYTVDMLSGTVKKGGHTKISKGSTTTTASSKTRNSSNGLASMREMTNAARTGGMSSAAEPVDLSSLTIGNPIRVVFDDHYSSNVPFFTAALDLTYGVINRGYRGAKRAIGSLFGKNYTDEELESDYLLKNPDIYDIPNDLKRLLIEFYLKKRDKTGIAPRAFTAADWRELQGNYTGGNRNLIERAFLSSPLSALEHSLGLWNYYVDEDGNVHAVDTYDWNVGETSANQGSYTTARDFMGRNGTRSSETKAQIQAGRKPAARRYDINLGKI